MVDVSLPNDFYPDRDHLFLREMRVRHQRFAELRESLLFDLSDSGLTDATVIAYHSDLDSLLFWCLDNELDVLRLDTDAIHRYLEELRSAKYSLNTIARRITAFRRFYNHLVERGELAESPMPGVHQRRPRPRPAPRTPSSPRLTAHQRRRMLAAAAAARDLAVLGLLFDGVSVSQVERASVIDISDRPPVLRTSFRGVPETASLSPSTLEALKAYLDGRTAGSLIVDRSQKPVDRFDINRILARTGKRAGIRTPVGLRRLPQPGSRTMRAPRASAQTSSTD